MSARRLQTLNHVFMISHNTWLKHGTLGNERRTMGPVHVGPGRKQKKNTDGRIDPIFISVLTCPFGPGSGLAEEMHISHARISLRVSAPPLSVS